MNSIYLQYGTYSSGTLTWSASKLFKPLIIEVLTETKRIKGYDLRDIPYNSKISTRSNGIKLTISANDLISDTNFDWIKSFYKADAWRFNYTDTNWSTASVRAELDEAGNIPVEYLEDHKKLRKVTLTLKQWYPDG